MKKTICPLFLLLCVLFFSGAYSLFAQESLINELEKIITEAESKDNVNARSYIHQYWQLAGLYLEKRRFQKRIPHHYKRACAGSLELYISENRRRYRGGKQGI